jgi:hypothetical protein
MDAMTGNFGCFTELLALTMKKVRTAAVVAAKTPEPTKKAARFLAAGAPRKTGGGRLVKASFASWVSDSLLTMGSSRPASRRARARLKASLSGIRAGSAPPGPRPEWAAAYRAAARIPEVISWRLAACGWRLGAAAITRVGSGVGWPPPCALPRAGVARVAALCWTCCRAGGGMAAPCLSG